MRWTWIGLGGALALAACSGDGVGATPSGGTCEGCHRPEGQAGIEDPHPWLALACVDCHGGDPSDDTKVGSHADPKGAPRTLRNLAPAQLDAIDRAYMQFINPSDYRVVERGCGSANGKVDSAGCHQVIIERSKRSIHTTLAGIVRTPRYNAGVTDTFTAEFGTASASHPGRDPNNAPPWTVDKIDRLEIPDIGSSGPDDLNDFHLFTMAKRCTKCHLGVYGGGINPDEFGNFRSSGCAACHMVYKDDGTSESDDPMLDKKFPSHPVKHQMTSLIPDSTCETCHWRGNRVGTAYKGWRERPSGSRDRKENTERNPAALHTRGADFFIFDEDTTNGFDETPPDVHHQRGLACIDCHVQRDVHGDGFIHTTMDAELGIECSDCHGSFDAEVQPGPDGLYRNTGGDILTQLRRNGAGQVVLISRLDGKEHPATQVASLEINQALDDAHETGKHGELECYACHTAWSQNCYGCHTIVDLRGAEKFPLSGESLPGSTQGNRDEVTLKNLHLGINSDGKIGVMMVQNLFQTVITDCGTDTSTVTCNLAGSSNMPRGKKLINSQVRHDASGRVGFSWGPAMPHTTASARTVQPCDRCHPKTDDSNLDAVRLVYGFGDGSYTFTDGETGVVHDLTKAIEADGSPTVSFAHPGSGPVPIQRIRKALETKVP